MSEEVIKIGQRVIWRGKEAMEFGTVVDVPFDQDYPYYSVVDGNHNALFIRPTELSAMKNWFLLLGDFNDRNPFISTQFGVWANDKDDYLLVVPVGGLGRFNYLNVLKGGGAFTTPNRKCLTLGRDIL